jgi:hypothetical protein
MEAASFDDVNAHPSRVDLDATRNDEFGVPRAFVTMQNTANDLALWDVMDTAMMQVANLFANGQPMQILQQNRDGLGTTHHETGSLWMHGDAAKGVTAPDGRFHFTENVYAAGPCLFPSIGSPNPMLTGIALARRTGDVIMRPPAFTPDAGFTVLFDGQTTGDWKMSTIRNQPGRDNPGRFLIRRGALEAQPGTDLGLLWLNRPTPPRYVLRLQWMITAPDDNSGVYVAFPNPEGEGYDNTAYVGVNLGFEIQIDNLARPDGAAIHRTGAVYAFKGATDGPLVLAPVGEWNDYEITVDLPDLTVTLNGNVVNRFHFAGDAAFPRRGQGQFIGLQTHTGRVRFRNIQWRGL